jgi:thioredoxin-like negative regulator of GroEL
MSLLDVIKHSDIDIQSKEDLSQLPEEVINEWLSRVVEHACQSAESIAYNDKTGKCQDVIDKIRAYMRKEIDWDEVYAARYAAYTARNASNAAYTAYSAAYYAANDGFNAAYYVNASNYAANAARNANETDTSVTLRMYQNWLMEELLAYEGEELISIV